MRRFIDRLRGLSRAGLSRGGASPENSPREGVAAVAENAPRNDDTEPVEPHEDLPDWADLDASSDYRPFLRKNVPAELKRLGLRRAWASDPAIAGFRGFADYDWNTNAVGYGLVQAKDVALAASTLLGQPDPDTKKEPIEIASVKTRRDEDRPEDAPGAEPSEDTPAQTGEETGEETEKT